jgi:hypothetical protein
MIMLQMMIGIPVTEEAGQWREAIKIDQMKDLTKLARCKRITEFIIALDGQQEFWSLVQILLGESPSQGSEKLRVCHI